MEAHAEEVAHLSARLEAAEAKAAVAGDVQAESDAEVTALQSRIGELEEEIEVANAAAASATARAEEAASNGDAATADAIAKVWILGCVLCFCWGAKGGG